MRTYDSFCSEHDVLLSEDGTCRRCVQDYDLKVPPRFVHLIPREGVTGIEGGPTFVNVDLSTEESREALQITEEGIGGYRE